jgi:hypothetical protein
LSAAFAVDLSDVPCNPGLFTLDSPPATSKAADKSVPHADIEALKSSVIIAIRSHGRHGMEEVAGGTTGSRRNEDIALDLMKFVAMTTGYGRTTSSGVGFQGTGAAAKPEEYAGHLLELYSRCLQAVAGKK